MNNGSDQSMQSTAGSPRDESVRLADRRDDQLEFMKHVHCKQRSLTPSRHSVAATLRGCAVYHAASQHAVFPPGVADLVDSLAPAHSAMKARPSMSLASLRLHSR
jgi:hypothetical protein